MPHQRAAYEKYHSRGFDILSISLDSPDEMPPEKLREWTQENGLVWRHIYDQEAFDSPLAKAFHVRGIPSIWLIGPDGQIAATEGECRGERLSATVGRVLGMDES